MPNANELLQTIIRSDLTCLDSAEFDDIRKQLVGAAKVVLRKGNVSLSSLMERCAEKIKHATVVVKETQSLTAGAAIKDRAQYLENMRMVISFFDTA